MTTYTLPGGRVVPVGTYQGDPPAPAATIEEARAAIKRTLDRFIPASQLTVLRGMLKGEEGPYFCQMLVDLAKRIEAMPKTYGARDNEAIVHLHYFAGGCDWWVTERDQEREQHQAYGFVCLGDPDCAECGYVSIIELQSIRGVELDLYWTPRPLSQIKQEKGL